MGRISRHGQAPFATGEIVPAKDLESDISKAYEEMGSIDNENIDDTADIAGTKLADGSMHGNRLSDSAVTAAHLIDGTVGEGRFQDNVLETDRFAAGSCSQQQSGVDGSVRGLTDDAWGLLDTQAITTAADSQGDILVVFYGIWAETADRSIANFQLRRNGVTVHEWNGLRGADASPTYSPVWPFQLWHIDEGLAVSTLFTYDLYGKDIASLYGGQSELQFSSLSCVEFRR